MKVSMSALCVLGIAIEILLIWFILVKPWRRTGHITLDGMFLIAFQLLIWQDPLANWIGPFFTYNAWAWNRGNWMSDIPGMVMPNAYRLPEPLLLVGPMYVTGLFGLVLVTNWCMTKARERWPELSNGTLIAGTLLSLMIFDVIFEPVYEQTGTFSYLAIPRNLALFRGRWFQWPMVEAVMWGTVWGLWAVLRFFRNDRGQTVAERGIEHVNGSEKKKNFIRFLAVSGICNVIMLAYVPFSQLVLAHADSPPRELLERSYMMDYMCGAGTKYACPGQGIPIPRRTSASVGPNGELIPGKVAPPQFVPFRTTK
jgi:hypothetical protein